MRGIVLAMVLAPVGIDEGQLRFERRFEPRPPSGLIIPARLRPEIEPLPPSPLPRGTVQLIPVTWPPLKPVFDIVQLPPGGR
jgi:hypothetical protein